jgi:hypothetical protein
MALEPYLNPGEEIIWEQRKHWHETLFFVSFCTLLLLLGLALLPIGVGLILLTLLAANLYYRSYGVVYGITDRRVIAVTGLLSRTVEELPLVQATVIEVSQPASSRMFGCGHLDIGPGKAACSLTIGYIRDPHRFRRIILEQREQLARECIGVAASLVEAAATEARRDVSAARPAVPMALPAPELAVWYFIRNGARQGPVASRELRRLARSGALTQQDLVWKEGMANWAPASKVRGLFAESGERPIALPVAVAADNTVQR